MGQAIDLAPVAVDDSPGAERAFAEARLQSRDNPDRSASLLYDILGEYGQRVIARPERPDQYGSVRRAVIDFLLVHPGVLRSWRRTVGSEAEDLLRTEGAEAVFTRLPVTPAATEAGLRIAQLAVERRQVGRARRILEEIARWPSAGEDPERTDVIEILAMIEESKRAEFPSGELVDRLEGLRRADPALADRLDVIDRTLRSGVEDSDPWVVVGRAWTELWQERLQDPLAWRRLGIRFDSPVSEKSLRTVVEQARLGTYLTVVPVLLDDLVVINEGYLLQGLDRYTGRLVWYRDFTESRGPLPRGAVVDLNRIVLTENDAFTILGHAFQGGRDGSGALVRFDPRTGDVRWEVAPAEALATVGYQEVEFAGPPLVVGDRVLVPLRQINSRTETLDFVVAVDSEDGRVVWIRMIASSGRVRNSLGPTFSELSRYQDDVLVSSATGAIARLDATTGEVLWLRRIPVPLRVVWSQSPPWLLGKPVVIRDQIATIAPDGRKWWRIAPESGEILGTAPIGPGTEIGSARRFMTLAGPDGGEDLLLGIGEDIVAASISEGVSRVWTLSELLEREGLGFGPSDAVGVRGMVVEAPDGLLIPLADGLLHLNTTDLSVRRIMDFPEAANVALDERSIVLAGSTVLASAMPELEALASLRDQVRNGLQSVLPALALFDLSRELGESELALEAMQAAVTILDSGLDQDWRDEVMKQILAAISEDPSISRSDLLALADRIAIDPFGRVQVELARGDYLVGDGQLPAALDVWSGVIQDAALARVVIPAGEFLSMPAGEIARRRLELLCDSNPGAAAMMDETARREVRDAIADRASSGGLVDVTLRNQDRPAALEAAMRAIEVLRDERGATEIAALAMVMGRSRRPVEDRLAIRNAALQALRDIGRGDLAADLLVGFEPGDSDPPAVVGPVDELRSLPGTTRVPVESVSGASFDRRVLVRKKEGVLQCLDPVDLSVRWSREVGGQDLQVIERNGRYVVGLSSRSGAWTGMLLIDADDGEIVQSIEDLDRFLPPRDSLSRNPDGFMPNGRPFFPFEVMLLPTSDDTLGMIRRDGDVAFLDLSGSPEVRWSRKDVLDRVNGYLVRPEGIHVFGARGMNADESVGAVVTLDPGTGDILWTAELGSGEIRWLRHGALGRLVAATLDSVHVLDPAAGMLGQARGWNRDDPRFYESAIGWIVDDRLVLVDGNGGPVAFDATHGEPVAGASGLPLDPDWVPGPLLDVLPLDLGRRILVFSDRLVLLGAGGDVLGADALPTQGRENLSVAIAEDGIYLLYRQIAGNSYRRRIQRLDPDRGLIMDGLSFDFEPLTTAAEELEAIDGWLLLLGMDEVQFFRVPPSDVDG